MRDTCGIHVSAVVPRYIEDTCGIHQGYIMRDMYLKCMQRGTYLRCKIHARYMQDTCILRGDQDTYRIHPRYIKKYIVRYMYLCKIHLRYIRIHKGYMYPPEYMQDTCNIHKDTLGYVSDRKPPPKRIGNPPAPGALELFSSINRAAVDSNYVHMYT